MGVECRGYEKISIFDQYLAISRKRYKIGPKLLLNVNRKPYVINRTVTLPTTLSDPDGPKRAITLCDKDALRHARLAVISTMRRRPSKYVDNATRQSPFKARDDRRSCACLRMLLGIKWYQFFRNGDVRKLTKQPKLTAAIQSRRLALFGRIARMDDNADAKRILLASPPADWRRNQDVPASDAGTSWFLLQSASRGSAPSNRI